MIRTTAVAALTLATALAAHAAPRDTSATRPAIDNQTSRNNAAPGNQDDDRVINLGPANRGPAPTETAQVSNTGRLYLGAGPGYREVVVSRPEAFGNRMLSDVGNAAAVWDVNRRDLRINPRYTRAYAPGYSPREGLYVDDMLNLPTARQPITYPRGLLRFHETPDTTGGFRSTPPYLGLDASGEPGFNANTGWGFNPAYNYRTADPGFTGGFQSTPPYLGLDAGNSLSYPYGLLNFHTTEDTFDGW